MFILIKKKAKLKILITFLILILMVAGCIISTDKTDDGAKIVIDNKDNGDAVYVDSKNLNSDISRIEITKSNRDTARSKAIELLSKTLNSYDDADEDFSKKIEDEIINMAKVIDDETSIENILRDKGYEDSVVYISSKSVIVTIAGKRLNENDVVKIKDVIFQYSGNNNIKIVEVE